MTRKPTWDYIELHDFILSRANEPFAWGGNDCCMFPADAIQAITGEDIAGDFRGKYTDELSAFKLIKSVTGGTSVADAAAYCAAKAGISEWRYPLLAQRGDLVVLEDTGRLIAGIVSGGGADVLCVGESGLKRFPITHVSRAWHY